MSIQPQPSNRRAGPESLLPPTFKSVEDFRKYMREDAGSPIIPGSEAEKEMLTKFAASHNARVQIPDLAGELAGLEPTGIADMGEIAISRTVQKTEASSEPQEIHKIPIDHPNADPVDVPVRKTGETNQGS